MWSVAGIKAAKADFLVKQALRRAQEEFDGIAKNANNANIDNKVEQLNNKSGVVKPKSTKSITKQLNRLQISSSGNSLTIPTPYRLARKKSITKLLNRLNIGKCHDDMTEPDCIGSLQISSPGNSRTVHDKTISNSDELISDEMDSSIMHDPHHNPERNPFERPIHTPLYGGKKRKSKRMKSRYRKKYKGTRNNKTRRYRK